MKMSKKRIVIFSFIHLGVLIAFFIVSFSAGMDEFDGKWNHRSKIEPKTPFKMMPSHGQDARCQVGA